MSSYLSSQTWLKDLISPLTGGKDPFANLSWIGVLGALALAALPHWYTIYLAESNKVQGGWSNVNPRFWVQQLIAKSATSKLSELELFILRGQSCQANAFENAPLFAATLIWANYTALPLATINNFVLAYLASRALYTVLYLNTTSKVNSFARTIAFNFGIVHMLSLWIRGGLNISPSLK